MELVSLKFKAKMNYRNKQKLYKQLNYCEYAIRQ